MPTLPTGTVTFLLTDTEGATTLLQRLGDRRYADVLEQHKRVLREAFDGRYHDYSCRRGPAPETARWRGGLAVKAEFPKMRSVNTSVHTGHSKGPSVWPSVNWTARLSRDPMKKEHGAPGFTTIEMVIVLALFGFVLVSLVGLHFVALSAGTAAETSSVAANLAGARMEELLSLPPEQLKDQNGTEVRREIPSGGGRTYVVRTTVTAPDHARLDLVVTVSWQVAMGAVCAGTGSEAGCAGSHATYSRTLQTRVQAPDHGVAQP